MKAINDLTTKEVGKLAKTSVANKLREMGYSVVIPQGIKNVVLTRSGSGRETLSIRVKSRRSGDWQIPVTEGCPPTEKLYDREFWVLVDFSTHPGAPDFYIMAGRWLRNKVYEDHQNYLLDHGGRRPVTPKSTHNKVMKRDIEQWKDRWDLMSPS